MSTLLPGIEARTVATGRITANVLTRSEPTSGTPVVLIHGNVSSALFWQPLMLQVDLPSYAIDLRGFGDTETAPVDASRGLRDFSDDVAAVLDALGVGPAVVVGWSMGGGVALQLLLDRGDLVRAVVLESPVSPYGFGGTAADGRPLTDDDAGCGGGGANPDFVQRLQAGDTSDAAPTSPRSVYRSSYVSPGHADEYEDLWVASMLSTKTGTDNYPGDAVASASWPGFAAGTRGVLNTMVPRYCNLTGIVELVDKPEIVWVRGEVDAIVSDQSFFDLNMLGKAEVVPGWPGEDTAPPQPMVSQTRAVLDDYVAHGGRSREVAWPDVGHAPHLERPADFAAIIAELAGSGVEGSEGGS